MSATESIARALEQIDTWIGPDGVGGAGAAVWHDGDIVAEHYAGESKPGISVDDQTLFGLASVTKPITAAVVVALAADGILALNDRVETLLPGFGESSDPNDPLTDQRTSVTIKQLLCHLSGLPEDLPTGTFRSRDLPTLGEITDRMMTIPLQFEPGSRILYSNAGYGTLGRIVEAVTNDDFWNVAWELILEPMGLHNIIARPGEGLDHRIATVQDVKNAGKPSEAYNGQYWRDLGLPWGGLYGTPSDLARLAGSFLDKHQNPIGEPWLSLMVTDQVDGRSGGVESLQVEWDPALWGLGWEVKGSKQNHWTGSATSPRTFCHFGASGTLVWADPDQNLALAVFGNRMVTYRWPFRPPRWAHLSDDLIAAVS